MVKSVLIEYGVHSFQFDVEDISHIYTRKGLTGSIEELTIFLKGAGTQQNVRFVGEEANVLAEQIRHVWGPPVSAQRTKG